MTSKSKALKIVESPRSKEIRENNERYHISSMKPIWRDRHTRRHGEKSSFNNSLKERQDSIKGMSKER